jgi:hypothetical protein
VGIIRALASILASVLIPAPEPQADAAAELVELKFEMAAVRDELTAIRELLDSRASAGNPVTRE